MAGKIPLSVIVATLNEEKNLPRCLSALEDFDEVLVVDSGSKDNSRAVAENFGAGFIDFKWNGQYPKKRQWCLDNLPLKYDRVLFIDADEEVTPELLKDLRSLDWACAGYFIDGLYVVDGTVLKRGLRNSKLCLFDRNLIEFPVVDDLDIAGMGEIEGHYQPVLKTSGKIGRLKSALLHHACEDQSSWLNRHDDYAAWEKGMIEKNAYPKDPIKSREIIKRLFRRIPCKGFILFVYHYIIRLGFLEGRKNLSISWAKMKYYDRKRQ